MVFFTNLIKNSFINKNEVNFSVGQKVYSKKNGSVCSIIKEIELNNIKHFELSIENDVYKREVILSEHALRLDYKK
jgi:hypothetical protein|tara:strand:- start:311 stop:538 length:228 start_codon:yes stop_codon:yes gene_type:complete